MAIRATDLRLDDPKIWKIQISCFLGFVLKKLVCHKKTVSERFGVEEELYSDQLFSWRIFGKLGNCLNTDLEKRKIWIFQILVASSLRSAALIAN